MTQVKFIAILSDYNVINYLQNRNGLCECGGANLTLLIDIYLGFKSRVRCGRHKRGGKAQIMRRSWLQSTEYFSK